jgi:hypothetical protein
MLAGNLQFITCNQAAHVFAASHAEHTLRIEVTGEKAANSINSYVNIDQFIILDGEEIGDTRFIINSEYNYPELSWGCFTKDPVRVYTGYSRRVFTKLGR